MGRKITELKLKTKLNFYLNFISLIHKYIIERKNAHLNYHNN